MIPVFNKVDYTRKCLETLLRHTRSVPFELLVVDNASSDETPEFLANVEGDIRVITNPQNLGFAKACNQGAAMAKGRYILFLNNDTELLPGWLEPLVKILAEDPEVGAVGSRLLYPDGLLQHAGVMVAENRLQQIPLYVTHRFHRLAADHPAANIRTDLQAVTGAAMLVRAEAFRAVDGFDEGYWNGYEDLDLCFKLHAEGWRIVYEPQSCLIHHESVSGPERFSKNRENDARLQQKWLGRLQPNHLVDPQGQVHRHPAAVRAAACTELPDSRDFNLLTLASDPTFPRTVTAYLETFSEAENVALHILSPHVEQVQAQVIELLEELGRDAEHIPDVSLIETVDHPLPLMGLLWAVDVVVASQPEVLVAAETVGLPALTALDIKLINNLRSHRIRS